MFSSYKQYRHRNCLDIDIRVHKVTSPYGLTHQCSMLVSYWSRFYKMYLGEKEIVTVKEKDFINWSEVEVK